MPKRSSPDELEAALFARGAEVLLALETTSSPPPGVPVLLEEVAAALTETAFAEQTAPPPDAPGNADRFTELLISALRRSLPGLAEARLRPLADGLVWTALGVLQGAATHAATPAAEARTGLLAAWRGLVADAQRR